MSRTIELRATRKDTGETFEVLCIDFMHNSIFLDGHTIEIDIDSVIIEQFTGMLDCKGAKIFECDTVKAPCGHVGTVIFSGASFYVEGYDSGDYYQGQNPDSWDWSKFEVIGNIHQNSELLK